MAVVCSQIDLYAQLEGSYRGRAADASQAAGRDVKVHDTALRVVPPSLRRAGTNSAAVAAAAGSADVPGVGVGAGAGVPAAAVNARRGARQQHFVITRKPVEARPRQSIASTVRHLEYSPWE